MAANPQKRNALNPQGIANKERLQNAKEVQARKREAQLDSLSPDEVLLELKNLGLPVYGTNKEKVDRLKKANGIQPSQDGPGKKNSLLENIDAISRKREERRRKMEEEKVMKEEWRAEVESKGRMGDVDFQVMIQQYHSQIPAFQAHTPAANMKICVCVRKRPIFPREQTNGEIDAISCSNPVTIVHEPRVRVDGITKYLENHKFVFDNTFGEAESTEDVYRFSLQPLCNFLINQGTVTCFAYGQTGSGKTFTMKGLQAMAVQDLYLLAKKFGPAPCFYISFYEIYGGRCFDLLNHRAKLCILEDGSGNIQVQGLKEMPAPSVEELHQLIEYGNSERTTRCTTSNDESSRSHAVCQLVVTESGRLLGKLRLVDLAGSERAQDCMSNNRQRRIEGAEINKSLLALKECIRALTRGGDAHIPYRGSKLTLVLRDSFTGSGDEKRIVMLTCICPGHSSADHSLNSLRYADRLKEQSSVAGPVVVNQFQPAKGDLRAKAKPDIAIEKPLEPEPLPLPQERRLPLKPVDEPPRVEKPSSDPRKPAKPLKLAKAPEPSEDKFRKSFKDIEYVHRQSDENQELLDFHEKIETILEEEEDMLETHVNAIKEDAQMLTEEGRMIETVQGEGVVDYDIDAYVQRLEVLVKHKLSVYQQLHTKLATFKKHLNEEEEVSYNMTQNRARKG